MWFTGDKSDLADIFPIPFPYNDMFSLWLLNIIAFSILEHALHVFNIPHFGCQDVLDRWVHVKSSIGIPICLRVCIADISRIIFIVVLDMRCSIWKKSLKGKEKQNRNEEGAYKVGRMLLKKPTMLKMHFEEQL